MRELGIYLDNPFNKIDASDDNIEKFYTDHDARLHNLIEQGIDLAHLESATEKAVAALINAHGATDISGTQLKSLTKTVDQVMAEFKEKILEWESVILSKVKKKDNPVYLEFYPHGRDEYHHITKGHINSLFDRVIKAFTKHKDLLGEEPAHDFDELKAEYNQDRKDQNFQKGDKSGSSDAWEVAVKEMAVQAFINLQDFAKLYPDQPEKIKLLFDQSIIEAHHPTPKDDSQQKGSQTPANPA